MDTLHLGLDDTDSRSGGCTTYVAHRLLERLECEVLEEPNLVRLNPNVPWKTRGNGALALRLRVEDAEEAFEVAATVVGELREPGADTGLVGFPGEPRKLVEADETYRRGVTGFLGEEDVAPVLDRSMIRSWESGRGLRGAAAALCWRPGDYTYELLAYRDGPRDVDAESLRRAASVDGVWDTLCLDGFPACIPNTDCPVLLGLRGDTRGAVEEAWSRVEAGNVAGHRVFRTNQGTDDHVLDGAVGGMEPGQTYRVAGDVAEGPRTIEGGHVLFDLYGGEGSVTCAAYEPTKGFRDTVRLLREGDHVRVTGSYREKGGGTLNLEKMEVLGLVETERVNPECPTCCRTMKSAGRDQGYRCRRCGTAAPGKEEVPVDRELVPGLYAVPPSARRHLSRPLCRSV